MAFVKLDTGILTSTLWVERECREVFITALLMATPAELTEPMRQIEVRTLEFTDFVVPPGWYGFIPAAGVGIIRMALVEREAGMQALEKLGSPDSESRSKEFDGRRLVRVDGGYVVLNFIKYREKDATAADRSRRWRERQKMKEQDSVAQRRVATSTRVIRHQAEAEAEAEAEADKPIATAMGMTRGETGNGRRISLPADWRPSEDSWAYAVDLGLDPDNVLEDFLDYWTGSQGARTKRTDWNRTWRVRCRELARRSSGGKGVRPALPGGETAAFARAAARLGGK